MVRQQVKDLLFALNRWAVLPSTAYARFRYRHGVDPEGFYLHLGCGVKYIPGMINVDGNALRRIDLWLDLRNRLPFPDNSVAFVYCSHTLEHLYPDDAIRLLREMCRVLSSDGCVRIAVPSLDRALDILQGKFSYELGRKFVDPRAQALDYLFCLGQHKYGYCYESLAEFAREAGFNGVTNYSLTSGVTPKRYGRVLVGNEPLGSLVVELGK